MLYKYDALSMEKKTPKVAPSPCDFVTLLEQDQATAIGNMHKKLVKIACVVWEICSWTDRQTDTDRPFSDANATHHNTSPPLPRTK